jgi:hypothetical protein
MDTSELMTLRMFSLGNLMNHQFPKETLLFVIRSRKSAVLEDIAEASPIRKQVHFLEAVPTYFLSD